MPHLVATLIYLSQIYSYYIRGDKSPLTSIAWGREHHFGHFITEAIVISIEFCHILHIADIGIYTIKYDHSLK